MDRCLLDTSIVSEIAQPSHRRSPKVVSRFRQYLCAHGRPTFSEMTYYEVSRGLRKKAAQSQERHFTQFCLHAELLPVGREVFDRAASL
jgi:tRNA(fMet)-specific endonuclease VapC